MRKVEPAHSSALYLPQVQPHTRSSPRTNGSNKLWTRSRSVFMFMVGQERPKYTTTGETRFCSLEGNRQRLLACPESAAGTSALLLPRLSDPLRDGQHASSETEANHHGDRGVLFLFTLLQASCLHVDTSG